MHFSRVISQGRVAERVRVSSFGESLTESVMRDKAGKVRDVLWSPAVSHEILPSSG